MVVLQGDPETESETPLEATSSRGFASVLRDRRCASDRGFHLLGPGLTVELPEEVDPEKAIDACTFEIKTPSPETIRKEGLIRKRSLTNGKYTWTARKLVLTHEALLIGNVETGEFREELPLLDITVRVVESGRDTGCPPRAPSLRKASSTDNLSPNASFRSNAGFRGSGIPGDLADHFPNSLTTLPKSGSADSMLNMLNELDEAIEVVSTVYGEKQSE